MSALLDHDEILERKAFRGISKTFRGEIYEDAPGVKMGKGYSNDGKPFDINSALYLRPVFRAIKNPSIRKIIIKKGIQSLGTFVTEKSAAYFAVHEPGDMCLYDATIEAANDHAKSRLGAFLKSIPALAGQIAEARRDDRHLITTTEFNLPGMTLRMWPLNLSSTQRMTLRYVIIHDAFLSGRTGLIRDAIGRTTMHEKDCKIIIESQGSEEGDDFDLQWQESNQGELYVNCPICSKAQPFEFGFQMPDGSWAGFNRGKDEDILLPDGSYNAPAVLKHTHYICRHCGGRWDDNRKTRIALDESSHYVPQNPGAAVDTVGFHWPNWINQRIPWGGDKVMLEYLLAKKADKEFANREPYRQWIQKRAARTWSDRLSHSPTPIQVGSYDPEKDIPNQHHRGFIIDVQKDEREDTAGTFWWEVYAADKSGNSFQLDRGFARSWDELDTIQEKWKVENHNVAIDGRKWTPVILAQVAKRFKMIEGFRPFTRKKIIFPSVWKVLLGDAGKQYPHPDRIYRAWSSPTPRMERVPDSKGELFVVFIQMWRWSNVAFKDQLADLRIGGEGRPKFQALAVSQLSPATQAKESEKDCDYESQMSAEMRTEKGGKTTYEKIRNQNHYGDTACMRLVNMAMKGLAGHLPEPE